MWSGLNHSETYTTSATEKIRLAGSTRKKERAFYRTFTRRYFLDCDMASGLARHWGYLAAQLLILLDFITRNKKSSIIVVANSRRVNIPVKIHRLSTQMWSGLSHSETYTTSATEKIRLAGSTRKKERALHRTFTRRYFLDCEMARHGGYLARREFLSYVFLTRNKKWTR